MCAVLAVAHLRNHPNYDMSVRDGEQEEGKDAEDVAEFPVVSEDYVGTVVED